MASTRGTLIGSRYHFKLMDDMMMRRRRVVIKSHGNSNWSHQGKGWSRFLPPAIRADIPTFGTSPWRAPYTNDGSGALYGCGEGTGTTGAGIQGAYASAPAEMIPFLPYNANGTLDAQITAVVAFEPACILANQANASNPGNTFAPSTATPPGPVDHTKAIKWRICYLEGPSFGSFNCRVRLDGSPYTNLINSSVNCAGATAAIKFKVLDVPADAARTLGHHCMILGQSEAVTAPVCIFSAFATDPTIVGGFAHGGFICTGGTNILQQAQAMQALPDGFIDASLLCDEEAADGQPLTIIINIELGVNVPGATLSVGPIPAASNTAAGHADNIVAIYNRWKGRLDALKAAGKIRASTQLAVWITTCHLVPTNGANGGPGAVVYAFDGAALAVQRLSAVGVAVASLDPRPVTLQAEADGWGFGGATDVHMNDTGFTVMSGRYWNEWKGEALKAGHRAGVGPVANMIEASVLLTGNVDPTVIGDPDRFIETLLN